MDNHAILVLIIVISCAYMLWAKTGYANNIVENLVMTDSKYSNCEVGCGIACRQYNTYVLSPVCYKACVEQCPNY
jgi:hypothetical protein